MVTAQFSALYYRPFLAADYKLSLILGVKLPVFNLYMTTRVEISAFKFIGQLSLF